MNDRDARRVAFIEERRRAGRASYSAILASAGVAAWDVIEPTYDRYLAELLGRTRNGGTVLDAACGTGKYRADIVASGRTVIGTDQLEGVLEVARAAHPDVPTGRVALQDLAFDETFDAVLMAR
jgi:2-polyprenyl-3-methyl-5-hydroxy-6-metoxy-1,4-benzoquinol methylase